MTASPVPVVVHIICAVAYASLGAFQFSAALRRRRPGWHRAAGRILVVLGLAVAFSALWRTQFYPRQPGHGELAYLFRLAFGSGMAASLILGVTAIRRGDVARHQAWMTRAFALALGPGTQVFTLGIGNAAFGTGEVAADLSLGAGWVVNLAVAEYVIRRRGSRRTVGRRAVMATARAAHQDPRPRRHPDRPSPRRRVESQLRHACAQRILDRGQLNHPPLRRLPQPPPGNHHTSRTRHQHGQGNPP